MKKHFLNSALKLLEGQRFEVKGNRKATFSRFLPLDQATSDSFSFCKHKGKKASRMIADTKAAVVLCNFDVALPKKSGTVFILVENPRLSFAKMVGYFCKSDIKFKIHKTAIIGANCKIGKVAVGEYAIIGKNVVIGDETVIMSGAVISDNVKIGKKTIIKSNAVIGQKGFGFEYGKDRSPFALKHIGGVKIGDNVEIGANTVICSGTLSDTVISDNVKIDDQVFIAHNVCIGERTLVIAGTVICGSAKIGADCWLAPNCSIMNGIAIGDNVLVGLGSVVLKSVPNGIVVAGNPAKTLRSFNKNGK